VNKGQNTSLTSATEKVDGR